MCIFFRSRFFIMDKSNINITYVPIGTLRPASYNPRKWDTSAIERIKESIKKFGLVDPLIVNSTHGRKNTIIGGHFRWSVAKELGLREVPVVYVNIPSLVKEKELNLRLNRNVGEWDIELLKSFDIDLLMNVGFDDNDLSQIWDENLGVEDDEFDTEDEIKQIKKPKTKLGQIYQLGVHRLVCGDAVDKDTVKALVGDGRVDMIYCDPPYNIGLDYDRGIGSRGNYGGAKTNDHKSIEDYRKFIKETLKNALTVANRDTHVFYWCDESSIGLIQNLYQELEIANRRVCLWVKNNQNVTPQVAFNKAYEACVYGTRGKPYLSDRVQNLNEILNKEVGTGNRVIDDILDLFNIWLVKRLPTQDYEHPTEKPPTLHEKALRRCTKPGDSVLDLFGGSGSTMVACEQLKRRCFLAEIEPIFCDLIIRRYEKLTGNKAELLN